MNKHLFELQIHYKHTKLTAHRYKYDVKTQEYLHTDIFSLLFVALLYSMCRCKGENYYTGKLVYLPLSKSLHLKSYSKRGFHIIATTTITGVHLFSFLHLCIKFVNLNFKYIFPLTVEWWHAKPPQSGNLHCNSRQGIKKPTLSWTFFCWSVVAGSGTIVFCYHIDLKAKGE